MALPKFITWGGSQNYSSGPDSGHPVEVTPGFVAFTPGNSLPAEFLNYIAGSLAREAQVIPTAGLNSWAPGLTVNSMTGQTTLNAMAWDSKNQLWVATAHSSGKYALSLDGGQSWFTIASLPTQTNCIIPLPNGTGFSFPQGGTTNIQFGDLQSTVTDTGTHLSVAAQAGATGFTHKASNLAVGFIYDSTNTRFRAYSTSNGTTITDITTSLPSALQNGPVVDSYFSTALGPSDDVLIAFGGTTPGTHSSQMCHATWNGSALTYTQITTRPGSATKQSIVGVAYNATLGLWGAMCYDATQTHFYTSPDLVTWTAGGIVDGLAGGLACVGAYWVTALAVMYGGAVFYRAYLSVDGTSWQGTSSPSPGTIFSVASHIVQGDGNVGMWSVQGAAVSLRVG